MTSLIAHVRLALCVGLVGGLVFGCREGLLTVQANSAIQPGQYLFAYITVPILAWLLLGPLLLMPLALLLTAMRRPAVLSPYAGMLACFGLLSITLPWVESTIGRLQSVGLFVGLPTGALLYALALGLAGAGAIVAAAAANWYGQRSKRPLHYAAIGVAVMALLLLLPIAHLVATDWKWDLRPVRASAGHDTNLPNVLLISIDTLRADHLGSYGDPHGLTPHLDRVADEGVLFTQAVTSSPWTLPAMASLFTAQYPRRHGAGALTNGRTPLGRSPLPPASWTLPSALHEHGFRTHAIVTNPYLALRYGFGAGFDSYENITIESEAFLAFSQTTALRLLTSAWPAVASGDRGETVSRRACQWLDKAVRSEPFFLWLHYIDPHPPYSRAGATSHRSMRGDMSLEPALKDTGIGSTSPDIARLRSGEVRLSASEKEAVHDLYRAEVRSVDQAVGSVLDTLQHLGLSRRTLVVIVGDHGEEFWEHGGVEHGRTVYDEVVRIPLLIRWPGHLPPALRVSAVVRITDVAPTVLDLLHLPTPPPSDGKSLVGLMHGEESQPRVALIENMLFAEERIGIRTDRQKYVRWETGKEEAYDLASDPAECRDLAASAHSVEVLRRAAASLEAESPAAIRASVPRLLIGGGAEALRALGYLQ